MRHARPAGRRRLAIAFCAALAGLCPGTALAAAPAPQDGGAPSFEGRLSEIAKDLYETARRHLLAPVREQAAALFDEPRAARIYRGIRDALRRLGDGAAGGLLRPAAERLANLAANARLLLKEWLGGPQRETATAQAAIRPGEAVPAARLAAGGAAELRPPPLPVPQSDLSKHLAGADPFEPVNRVVFDINDNLRTAFFDPAANFYLAHTSLAVQTSVRHFFGNLHEPVTIVASALEGRLGDAGTAAARFGINSTLGIAGLFDPATGLGYTVKERNLEQALCAAGLPAGPYLVLPILGPATLRDAAGRLATVVAYFEVMGAYVYVPYRLSDLALQYADRRDRLSFINSLSLDPYVAQRALYLTMRDLSCGEQAALDRQFFTK